jgi:hypothetical protein
MRHARDFPQPELVSVGLADRIGIENARDVGLGLDVEHGRVFIGAEDRGGAAQRAGDVGVLPGWNQWKPHRAAAMHEEAVERVRERLHAVVVRDERKRGLRLPAGDHSLRRDATQARAAPYGPRDLREDVEREPVTGVGERAVASRVDLLEAFSGGIASR